MLSSAIVRYSSRPYQQCSISSAEKSAKPRVSSQEERVEKEIHLSSSVVIDPLHNELDDSSDGDTVDCVLVLPRLDLFFVRSGVQQNESEKIMGPLRGEVLLDSASVVMVVKVWRGEVLGSASVVMVKVCFDDSRSKWHLQQNVCSRLGCSCELM
jgi:hypothetical protein